MARLNYVDHGPPQREESENLPGTPARRGLLRLTSTHAGSHAATTEVPHNGDRNCGAAVVQPGLRRHPTGASTRVFMDIARAKTE